jgi:hypothetical protein
MAKKTFSEEAKKMFSSWKDELEKRDGHILERKKKRDEDNEKLNDELKKSFKEVSEDLNNKAKKAFEIFNEEFSEFSKTVKEGTADLYKKAEVERHAEQLLDFLNKIKTKSADKFKEVINAVRNNVSEEEIEFSSEKEDPDVKNGKDDIETLIKQAQEEFEKGK